jgi:hypothetical protein
MNDEQERTKKVGACSSSCLFNGGFFNYTGYVVTSGRMAQIMNWEQCGRKQSLPLLNKVLCQYLPGGTQKETEKLPGQKSNLRFSKYEAGMLTT